jgi:hypothetical protein
MRNMFKNTLALTGIWALAGCSHAPATHVAETATARPAPVYAAPAGIPVRATHDGSLRVTTSGLASEHEVRATLWASATHHCNQTRAIPVEIKFAKSQEFVPPPVALPIVMSFHQSLKQGGDLTFVCKGNA